MQFTLTQKLWMPTAVLALAVTAMSATSVLRTRQLLAESSAQQTLQEEKLEL